MGLFSGNTIARAGALACTILHGASGSFTVHGLGLSRAKVATLSRRLGSTRRIEIGPRLKRTNKLTWGSLKKLVHGKGFMEACTTGLQNVWLAVSLPRKKRNAFGDFIFRNMVLQSISAKTKTAEEYPIIPMHSGKYILPGAKIVPYLSEEDVDKLLLEHGINTRPVANLLRAKLLPEGSERVSLKTFNDVVSKLVRASPVVTLGYLQGWDAYDSIANQRGDLSAFVQTVQVPWSEEHGSRLKHAAQRRAKKNQEPDKSKREKEAKVWQKREQEVIKCEKSKDFLSQEITADNLEKFTAWLPAQGNGIPNQVQSKRAGEKYVSFHWEVLTEKLEDLMKNPALLTSRRMPTGDSQDPESEVSSEDSDDAELFRLYPELFRLHPE